MAWHPSMDGGRHFLSCTSGLQEDSRGGAWVGGVRGEFPARWGMWSLLRLIVDSWMSLLISVNWPHSLPLTSLSKPSRKYLGAWGNSLPGAADTDSKGTLGLLLVCWVILSVLYPCLPPTIMLHYVPSADLRARPHLEDVKSTDAWWEVHRHLIWTLLPKTSWNWLLQLR